jgi:hypothetical protein
MPTLATIFPSRGHEARPAARLRPAFVLLALALVAVAPSASAIVVDPASPTPPFKIGFQLGGMSGSVGPDSSGTWGVCWQFSPERQGLDAEIGADGVIVQFPFIGPIITLDETVQVVPEGQPFDKVPARQPIGFGTQEAGASPNC